MSRTAFMKWVDRDGPKVSPSYIYVASSWTNVLQQALVGCLRALKLNVYDFRNPGLNEAGFKWEDVDPNWRKWTPAEWRSGLDHDAAKRGFERDKAAMDRAECCILVLPCGRSAHLEAGYMAAQCKPVFTLALGPEGADLMVLLLGPSTHLCTTMNELFEQ